MMEPIPIPGFPSSIHCYPVYTCGHVMEQWASSPEEAAYFSTKAGQMDCMSCQLNSRTNW